MYGCIYLLRTFAGDPCLELRKYYILLTVCIGWTELRTELQDKIRGLRLVDRVYRAMSMPLAEVAAQSIQVCRRMLSYAHCYIVVTIRNNVGARMF